jgi:hypothetical protein
MMEKEIFHCLKQQTMDTVGLIIYNLTSERNREEKKEWKVTWNSHDMECDIYGVCGIFASCNSPICRCLKEFEPKNKEEWNRQNWTELTEGCGSRTPLQQCERERNQNTTVDKKADGFLKLQMVRVPETAYGYMQKPVFGEFFQLSLDADKETNMTVIIIITVIAGTVLVLACAYIMRRMISYKHSNSS